MLYERTARVADFEFTFSCEAADPITVTIELQVESVNNAVDTYLICASIKEPSGVDFELRRVAINWTVPIIDMHGLYFGGNPGEELTRLPYWKFNKQTCANTGVPYISLIHRSGENRAAFGLLDQITETSLNAELSEATRCYHFNIEKPSGTSGPGGSIRVPGVWEERLFVSTARQPWPDTLKTYVNVTDGINDQPKMPVPEHAFDPVFDSWTAIHHDVSHDWIIRNAMAAAKLGFKTWITDDGWFIEKGQFANYQYVGDWQPYQGKFPDFAGHVRAVQALGMRYILWVSPFMIGKDSQAAQRFAHLLSPGRETLRFDNLAPEYEESRTIIANLLQQLVSEYHLDGLKLDFIDSVFPDPQANTDHTSFGQSLFATLQHAIDCVRELRPDILVEFRNPYTNLASRSYANIYRSSDVPLNFFMNRWQAVMLRLLTPDRAVHLDPALWHPLDTDEDVAVHLINLLVSVPMVSIELDKYPQSHLDLIRHWIGFYNDHRDTLVHGQFNPTLRTGNIPAISFEGKSEQIIALYDDIPVKLAAKRSKVWILNASTRPYIEVELGDRNGNGEVTIRDKFGKVISKQPVCLPVAQTDVEVGGSIELIYI